MVQWFATKSLMSSDYGWEVGRSVTRVTNTQHINVKKDCGKMERNRGAM